MTDLTLVDNFLRGYLVAALWSSTDNADDSGGEPLDSNFDIDDIDPFSKVMCRNECEEFIKANKADIDEYCERRGPIEDSTAADCAGHDFWLTRNGHGCGYWDRGLGKLGDRLSDAARTSGSRYVYVGDNGRLYFCVC